MKTFQPDFLPLSAARVGQRVRLGNIYETEPSDLDHGTVESVDPFLYVVHWDSGDRTVFDSDGTWEHGLSYGAVLLPEEPEQ